MKESSFHKKTIVIAVGGSLIVPDTIDYNFVGKLKEIAHWMSYEENYRLVLSIGGGKTARLYQSALRHFSHVKDEDLDWLGIRAIQLNAEFVWRAFSDLDIYPKVLEKPEDYTESDHRIFIVSAHRPGFSSDTDAVLFAEKLHAREIINFSNINQVYDRDPRKFSDARPLSRISWEEYISLIPPNWTPGLSAPFDPIASRRAMERGMKVIVLGSSLENLKNYLAGGNFKGTVIS